MKRSFYFYSAGELVRRDNTLRFITEDGDTRDLPVEQISDIYLMNQMTFNTAFLNLISQHNIVLHMFNYYDYYIGSFYPRESLLSGKLIIKQSQFYLEQHKRLEIARKFIEAASFNIYRNLRYYNSRGREFDVEMKNIQQLRSTLKDCESVQEIMGVEGNIRKEYYSCWNKIINNDMEFSKRVMHPPDNEMNSLISYVNTLIYTKVLSQIYKTQLNPTVSYLHEPGERRFSLCLDISEVFKPLIGDRLLFSLLNKKQITKNSFEDGLNGLHLKKEASMVIMQELDKRLKKTILHKELNKNVTYEYLIRLECYKLIKHLLGEKEYFGFEIWW